MAIRPASIDDLIAISQLVTATVTTHIAPTLNPVGRQRLMTSVAEDATRQRFEDGWLHLVDASEGTIHGVIVIKPICHLYHLFVTTRRQRLGIGRQLFEAADAWTRHRHGSRLQTVNASINAIEAYHAFGFEADGSIREVDGITFQPMKRLLVSSRRTPDNRVSEDL